MRLRFSIRRLMGIVLLAAIGLTAWRFAGKVSANIVFNLTVVVLILATYKSKFTLGRAGARWLGFATLGWAHLVLWLAGMPWGQNYSFNLSFISDILFWILAADIGTDQLAFNLRLDSEPAIARTVILQCLTSLIVGFLGAGAFSFASLVGSVPPVAGSAAGRVTERRPSSS
jgi:hypothetical protein